MENLLKKQWVSGFCHCGGWRRISDVSVSFVGGEAETAIETEIEAGLEWWMTMHGLATETRLNGLVSHMARKFRERSLSVWSPFDFGRSVRRVKVTVRVPELPPSCGRFARL